VRELLKYLKRDCLDYVVASSTTFKCEALENYRQKRQIPVCCEPVETFRALTRAKILCSDVASDEALVRHDSLKLASELKKIFEDKKK